MNRAVVCYSFLPVNLGSLAAFSGGFSRCESDITRSCPPPRAGMRTHYPHVNKKKEFAECSVTDAIFVSSSFISYVIPFGTGRRTLAEDWHRG
ncbi:unnamed protein product, partial [Iphiclides podalirius]